MTKDIEWLREEVYALYPSSYSAYVLKKPDMLLKTKMVDKVIELLDQLDEPEKPVIPQFVADWIEDYRDHGGVIVDMLGSLTTELDSVSSVDNEVAQWFRENTEKMLKALMDGYEVEKEKKYRVIFNSQPDDLFLFKTGEHIFIGAAESSNGDYWIQHFTEAEIKAIDKRFWAFAEEVTK